MAFTLDTEARGLLPFYAILVQLDTFTVLRQNALTFTLPPPYGGEPPSLTYTLHSNQTVWESESACAQNHLARVSSLGPFSVLEIRFCPMPTKSGLP